MSETLFSLGQRSASAIEIGSKRRYQSSPAARRQRAGAASSENQFPEHVLLGSLACSASTPRLHFFSARVELRQLFFREHCVALRTEAARGSSRARSVVRREHARLIAQSCWKASESSVDALLLRQPQLVVEPGARSDTATRTSRGRCTGRPRSRAAPPTSTAPRRNISACCFERCMRGSWVRTAEQVSGFALPGRPVRAGRIAVDTGTEGDDNMLSAAMSASAWCARNIATPAASSSTAAAAIAGRTQRSSSVHHPSSTSATRAMMRDSSSFQYASPAGAAYSERSPRTTSSSSFESSRMSRHRSLRTSFKMRRSAARA